MVVSGFGSPVIVFSPSWNCVPKISILNGGRVGFILVGSSEDVGNSMNLFSFVFSLITVRWRMGTSYSPVRFDGRTQAEFFVDVFVEG